MWYVYTPITTPVITAPTAANNGVGINGEVEFTCTACSDVGKHVVDGNPTYPPDTVTYTWWGWRAVSGALFDATGSVYLVLDTRLSPDFWVEVMPGLVVTDSTVVYKFGPSGRFLTKLVFDGLPFFMYPPIAVDPGGNICHLEYYPARVDFVKEELVVEDAESFSASDLVGLRESLEPEGWRVSWDAAKCTATARRGRTELMVQPGRPLAAINGHAVPVSYAAVIRSGRVYASRSLLESVRAREHGPGRFARLAR
jgi:hypothetical protein